MIGTIGYSGNAASLQTKNLPPHLHFGYLRAVSGIDGKAAPADVAGILNPLKAVKFLKCWEDSPPATRSTLTGPR